MIKYKEKPWLIHVPAAAVIHEWRALFVIAERTICVDENKIFFYYLIVFKKKRESLFFRIILW
jgi:hypothetical protein